MSEKKKNQLSERQQTMRNNIFAAAKRQKKIVPFFGEEVEVWQPSMSDILQSDENASTAENAAMMLVKYTFIPGTRERVFEDTDVESILEMPFGTDLQTLQDTMNNMMGLDVKAEIKNSGNEDTTST